MVQIKIWTRVGPTEDELRVIEAVKNIFPTMDFKVNEQIVEGKGKSRDAVGELKQKIWAKCILDTAREMMLRNLDGDSTELLIHKQAAYANKVALVNRDWESPLGAIHIEIQSKKLEELIDWIAPETIKGKPLSAKAVNSQNSCLSVRRGKNQ